jgi:hypothetical protein
MLEKDIEAKACQAAKNLGWLVYKFASPARRSVPDRMFIKRGRVVFIEFKRPGGKLTRGQEREGDRIRQAGLPVYVCDSAASAQQILAFWAPSDD